MIPEPYAAFSRGLTRRLAEAGDELTLTFDELDALSGGLPEGAWRRVEWWGNNRPDHVPARAWLDAGFRVSAVELQGFVTFVRIRDRLARLEVVRTDEGTETVTGTLRLVDGAVEADAGAAWLLDDAFYAALPDGCRPRRVRPTDGPAFLVACWFSLREPGVRGRLIDTHGHELTPEQGRALVDSLAGTGTEPDGRTSLPDTGTSWSGVSLRAPDRAEPEWDPDAAPMRDVLLRVLAAKKEREAAGLPEPPPPPRPVAPTGDEWRQGRDMVDVVKRGMRVFHDGYGQGTVLSVVPRHHKTEALVHFDSGVERLVGGILLFWWMRDHGDRSMRAIEAGCACECFDVAVGGDIESPESAWIGGCPMRHGDGERSGSADGRTQRAWTTQLDLARSGRGAIEGVHIHRRQVDGWPRFPIIVLEDRANLLKLVAVVDRISEESHTIPPTRADRPEGARPLTPTMTT